MPFTRPRTMLSVHPTLKCMINKVFMRDLVDKEARLSALALPANTSSWECRRHLQGTDDLVGGADAAVSPLDAYSGNWRQAAFAQFRGPGAGQLQEEPENAPGPGNLQHFNPATSPRLSTYQENVLYIFN